MLQSIHLFLLQLCIWFKIVIKIAPFTHHLYLKLTHQEANHTDKPVTYSNLFKFVQPFHFIPIYFYKQISDIRIGLRVKTIFKSNNLEVVVLYHILYRLSNMIYWQWSTERVRCAFQE